MKDKIVDVLKSEKKIYELLANGFEEKKDFDALYMCYSCIACIQKLIEKIEAL